MNNIAFYAKLEPGFQYVIDQLELMSGTGRRMLADTLLTTDTGLLQKEYDHIGTLMGLQAQEEMKKPLVDLRHRLMELQDIAGTLAHIGQRTILDEVELFQTKQFAHLCISARQSIFQLGIEQMLPMPDLAEIFNLLDPDNTHIPNFYIYDSYHPELAPLRKQLKGLQTQLDTRQSSLTPDELASLNDQIAATFSQQQAIERQVIIGLSEKLFPKADLLNEALRLMGRADILLAKAAQAADLRLSRPRFSDSQTAYTRLSNLRLRHRNEAQHLRYQPIDIAVKPGTCLITGANMAGKTVALKTLGIAQLMAQFGMFVPAQEAEIIPVEDVVFCIGDEQNEMNGLSSYASEITKISQAIDQTRRQRILLLIDEPARTTNPIEGKAIVQSVATLLQKQNSITVVTTHYSQLGLDCRKLRVKGFMESLVDAPLTPQNINKYMDYSLQEDDTEEVPHEALRIATILGCDDEMIQLAQQKLER